LRPGPFSIRRGGAWSFWKSGEKIPVGPAAKALFDWLKTFKAAFEAFGDACENAMIGVDGHPAMAARAGGRGAVRGPDLGHLQRRWKVCAIVLAGFLFILNQGYWKETTESLSLVAFVCIICMVIGVPVGVAAAHRPRLSRPCSRCWT
jgi:glycine betaine/proline transport system permease protein